MTGGSLGLRSGSYGSLQPQFYNGVSPSQATTPNTVARKPAKMLKEKEKLLLHWIFKFVGRKKVGMLFLCLVSAAVFILVLCVGKGEDSREGQQALNIKVNNSSSSCMSESSPACNKSSIPNILVEGGSMALPPSPPSILQSLFSPPDFFLGYSLPPGHRCEAFTLPPPPSDKKRTGPRPCPVCYLPVEEAVALMPKAPSPSPILSNLTYVHEGNLTKSEFGGSDFGGYPSLKQRNDSFDIKESMNVHCGFIRGIKAGNLTGFDIDDSSLLEMELCHGVVVASAIFGNYDILQQPKNISEAAKENVCFYMFVDQETEAYMRNASGMDSKHKIGLWRIVVIHNLPYTDPRRNGKIPKLLLHRLFPNARYSIWLDGKLELVVDPYQILERFLWRKNTSFAISKHYKRFDVFVEAEANKAAAKYDNASIDFQVEFYRREGLTPYSAAKLPITSDVPEGCVILREHIPITNLFMCLWFNEVDRFTARDQISFSIVRDKITLKVKWGINMFLDCERRNFVVQAYHKDVLDHLPPRAVVNPPALPPPLPPQPPPPGSLREVSGKSTSTANRKTPLRRGRDKRRHRKVAAGSS